MELEIIALLAATTSLGLAGWALRSGRPPERGAPGSDLVALKAELLAELRPETEDAIPNPGGCTKESHVWRKRPHLVSGYEEVYYCAKGCMSTLRHRVK